jgi:hypothetical protein
MEKRTWLPEEVRIVSPAAALPEAGEMLDDELDAVVGGLERVWLPGDLAPATAAR